MWLGGCARPDSGVFSDVDPTGWWRGQSVSVTWDNSDTVTLHYLTLVVGYDSSVPFGGVNILVTTFTPDSLTLTETVHVRFDRGDLDNRRIFEARTPYRTGVRFMRLGEYRFSFAPEESLRGIKSVGFSFDGPARSTRAAGSRSDHGKR